MSMLLLLLANVEAKIGFAALRSICWNYHSKTARGIALRLAPIATLVGYDLKPTAKWPAITSWAAPATTQHCHFQCRGARSSIPGIRYVTWQHIGQVSIILLSQAEELTAYATCQHVRYSGLTEHDYRLMLLSLLISNKSIIDSLPMIRAIDYYLCVLSRLNRCQNIPGNYLSSKSIIAYRFVFFFSI